MMFKRVLALALASLTASCATVLPQSAPPQDQFFQRLMALCGGSYAGRVVSTDPDDREFASNPLVMHVRTCSTNEIRIPFHVGNDRSRTWVVTREGGRLKLTHVHRHQDGQEDALSRYGGSTVNVGNPRRQEFPADQFTRDLFVRENIAEAAANVWAMEVEPGRTFAYELRRPGRHFRVEFDLTRLVAPPPPAWGDR